MASHVALLRGINVGGRNKVPMADLREVATSLGHTGVSTYIQSGNVLFSTAEDDTEKLAAALESAIEESFGIWSSVVVLSGDELARVLAANPYPDEPNPRMVHVVFLNGSPPRDLLGRVTAAGGRGGGRGRRGPVGVPGRGGRPAAGAVLAHAARLRHERAGAERTQDPRATEEVQAGPGRHGQELGHRDQAPVAERGEQGRLDPGANHPRWRPEGVLPCPNRPRGPPTGGSPSPTCKPRPIAARAGRCSPATKHL